MIKSARVSDEEWDALMQMTGEETLGGVLREIAGRSKVWGLMRSVPDEVWIDIYAMARLSGGEFDDVVEGFHDMLDREEIVIDGDRLMQKR